MNKAITVVGLDTAKKSIDVAMLLPDRKDPIEWSEANESRSVKRLIKKLKREAVGELKVCYEAGPCGYALQRQFRDAGVDCIVVAPSLVPVKPGDRIKTNRRDAIRLAKQHRAGALTEVRPPTPAEEAVRDLCRAREDIREDLVRARHRLGKMLLRRALTFDGRAWTKAHREWLVSLKFEHKTEQTVFNDYLRAVDHLEDRLRALEAKLTEVSEEEPYRDPVGWLRCFRGIDTVTAMSIVAELHGFSRFTSPRDLMSYLGLVPSESSTGERHRRGAITKAGNGHVRRLLIESSWHYRHRPSVGAKLRKRRDGQPGWVVEIADRAQARLHRKYWRLVNQNKPHNKAVTAVARELAGFLWAVLSHQAAVETKPLDRRRKSRANYPTPALSAKEVLQEARRGKAGKAVA